MSYRGSGAPMAAEEEDVWSNEFWSGPEQPGLEAGVEVVLARLKHGTRTLEDLRAFYRERASIEEDYAKRLNRLARGAIGGHETGSLKQALDRTRHETANAASAHEKLAHMMRTALEQRTKEFEGSRDAKRKQTQAAIEKALKNKSQQEAMVVKARDKYKADCVAINGYTAQTSLVQGRDLDKAQAKLDKAQATVATNEKEYKLYLSALKETTSKWVMDWKSFCDLAQDLEEERLNYMRISLWDYANGVSFICVTDDEFCENVRKSLEVCDASADLSDFIKHHRTGRLIPDPPPFIDYAKGDHNYKPTAKTANFARSSARTEIQHTGQSLQDLAAAIKPVQMARNPQEYAALGNTGAESSSSPQRSGSPAKKSSRSRSYSHSSSARSRSSRPVSRQTDRDQVLDDDDDDDAAAEADQTAQEIQPLRPKSRASRTETPPPQRDSYQRQPAPAQQQQQQHLTSPQRPVSVSSTSSRPSRKVDPLEEGLAALRDPAKAREMYDTQPSPRPSSRATSTGPTTVDLLRKKSARSLYSPSQQQQQPQSQSQSPTKRHASSGADAYASAAYSQAGEPDPRRLSSARSASGRSPSPARSASGRPVSPGPVATMMQPPGSRSTSPAPPAHADPAQVVGDYGQALPGEQRSRSRASSFNEPHIQQAQQQQQRPPSQYSQQPPPQQVFHPSQQQQAQMTGGARSASPARPHSVHSSYAHAQSRPQSTVYQQPQQQPSGGHYYDRPGSAAAPYGTASTRGSSADFRHTNSSPVYNNNGSVNGMTPAQMYAQQAAQSGGMHRASSAAGMYSQPAYAPPPQQSGTPVSTASGTYYGQPPPGAMYQQPARGTPSPAPQPQGRPVLFFVRAMYDYEAQDPEEFSFTANDIIAVHQTDSSGWWTGELLDENRRFPGRTIFPSNFCTLLE